MPRRQRKGKKRPGTKPLSEIRPKVAGIDIGTQFHCVSGPVLEDGSQEVQEFGTTTSELEKMVDWMKERDLDSAAMESTSVYWIPPYEMLESKGIDVLLANAQQLANVPGRKTDVLDCQWIQKLHSHGLLNGSFRPIDAICAIRTLKRQLSNLVAERTKAVQWMQKSLDQMNVQVHHAVSEMTGKTGMDIIRAIVAGERDPQELAKLRDRRCKKTVNQVAEYLKGNWRSEHLFNLEMALRLYDQLQEMIEAYEKKLLEDLEELQPPERKNESVPEHPNLKKRRAMKYRGDQITREALWRLAGVDLTHIDGISSEAALVVLTEIGFDLNAFPNEKKFVSWLRLSPRHSVSGGKQIKKRKNAMGSTRVANVLRMAAISQGKSKTALGAYYRHVSRRKGASVAIFATARKLATLIFRMLRFGQGYVDVGEQAYERQYEHRRLAALKANASSMGFTLVPTQEVAGVVSG